MVKALGYVCALFLSATGVLCEESHAVSCGVTECSAVLMPVRTELAQIDGKLKGCENSVLVVHAEAEKFRTESAAVRAGFEAERATWLKDRAALASQTEMLLKEVETLKTGLSSSEEVNRALLTTKADLESRLNSSAESEQQRVAALTAEVASLSAKAAQLDSCQVESERHRAGFSELEERERAMAADRRRLAEEKEGLLRSVESERVRAARISSDAATCRSALAEVSESTMKIYNAAQFWRTYDHSVRIGKAFSKFVNRAVNRLMGEETYELCELQLRLWYAKTNTYMTKYIGPHYAKFSAFYSDKISPVVNSAMSAALVYSEKPMEMGRKGLDAALSYVDRYMERVVTNLASVSPEVRSLFPDTFYDRCFAFAFIAVLLHTLTSVVKYVYTSVVLAPLSLFAAPKAAAPANKKVVKSSKSSTSNAYHKQGKSGISSSNSKVYRA